MAISAREGIPRVGPPEPRYLLGPMLVADLVDDRLSRFFEVEAARWAKVHPALGDLVATVRSFVESGGKRLRASFCYWGWRAALLCDDEDDSTLQFGPAIDVAAAVEMLHAFALMHDDVMDGSALRRGRPSLHQQLAATHTAAGWVGEPRRFGEGTAVLLGDAALAWADCLLAPHRPAVESVWNELRVELMMGQYLDIIGAARGTADVGAAWQLAALKSGNYTVMRPLQLGAALAGRLGPLEAAYRAFGEAIGEAFQLRDDLLGVYGDPAVTGKPAGEDLREGKPTALVAFASETAATSPSLRAMLSRLGDRWLTDADVECFRQVFDDCGASAQVEAAIARRVETGLAALQDAPINPLGRQVLAELGRSAAWRVR